MHCFCFSPGLEQTPALTPSSAHIIIIILIIAQVPNPRSSAVPIQPVITEMMVIKPAVPAGLGSGPIASLAVPATIAIRPTLEPGRPTFAPGLHPSEIVDFAENLFKQVLASD